MNSSMYSTRLKLTIAAAAALSCAFGSMAARSLAEEGEESSLLLNAPVQSAKELPPLPPPTDPSAAAPVQRETDEANIAESRGVVSSSEEALPAPPDSGRSATSQSITTRRPFLRAVEAEPVSAPAHAESRLAPVEGEALPPGPILEGPLDGPVVHPVSAIKYDTDRGARKLYAKSGSVDTVLIVQNPADGCFYEIPVCLPGCCVGEPLVAGKRGLLGRGVVEYCWPCGFEVEVIFRLRGDVKVEYEG